jgi:hypothetical protein
VPTLPDQHVVRTYPHDYAGTETESEAEGCFEVDTEDEEQVSIEIRLQQNQSYMDDLIASSQSTWILEPQEWKTTEGADVILIRKPTDSLLTHRQLNPYIYRNIKEISALDELASLLDTPPDWETTYLHVVQSDNIIEKLNHFHALPPETLEATIQSRFIGLVSSIAARLDLFLLEGSETPIVVGGLLARYQYDLRSKTDPHFMNASNQNLIASEVKTDRAFDMEDMWYHDCRGIQVLSALYAFNCPTFLLTQKQWKLFIENRERNAIFTFPHGSETQHSRHVNSAKMGRMGTTFLKVITICLLSKRTWVNQESSSKSASKILETPKSKTVRHRHFDTVGKPPRRSLRLKKSSGSSSRMKQPSFVSGYVNEKPVYSTVRVLPQDVVLRIENEIALKEKANLKKQASEATLVDES